MKLFFCLLLILSMKLYAQEEQLEDLSNYTFCTGIQPKESDRYLFEPVIDSLTDSSVIVHGCVNAITGSFLQSTSDIVTGGPEPLVFNRYYNNSSLRNNAVLAVGYNCNHPVKVLLCKHGSYDVAMVEEAGGSYTRFCSSKKPDPINPVLYLDPNLYSLGLTNCGQGDISGQTNLKNSVLQIHRQHKNDVGFAILRTGAGGILQYDRDGMLTVETKPSGNKVYYLYDATRRLSTIYTTDRTGTMALNWLQFTYPKPLKNVPPIIQIKASNGREATYERIFKKADLKVKNNSWVGEVPLILTTLANANVSDKPPMQFSYFKSNNDKLSCDLEKITYPDGRFLEISYTKNCVSRLTAPAGKDGKHSCLYNFKYSPSGTTVIDANQRKIEYGCSGKEKKIASKTVYEGDSYYNYKIYSNTRFYWGLPGKKIAEPGVFDPSFSGFLLGKVVLDGNFNGVYLERYEYDERGNIIEKCIHGNLTGKGSDTFSVEAEALGPRKPYTKIPKTDCESYSTYSTYSNDGFNLLLSEKGQDGSYTEYQYLPGTNLLTAKLVYNGSQICLRQFFEYNIFGAKTSDILDDGITSDPNNLTGVTQRLIKRIDLVSQQWAPGFGMPYVITDYYYDVMSGQEIQLKKQVIIYGKFDLPIRIDFFDADNQFCYSIHSDYDERGNLISETDPLGQSTIYRYDANNNKIYEEALGSGSYKTFVYDLMNRLVSTHQHDSEGNVFSSENTYDIMSQKIASTDAYGHTTQYVYDQIGRQIQIIYPAVPCVNGGLYTPYEKKEYNVLNQMTSFTDKNLHTTTYRYTTRGTPVQTNYADGTCETCEYNLNGSLKQKTEKNGLTLQYEYDHLQRNTKVQTLDPQGNLLKSQANIYNGFHLIKSIDGMGIETEFLYDEAGRKIAQITENRKITYEYDSISRLVKTITWIDELHYYAKVEKLDWLDRVVESSIEDEDGTLFEKTTYKYDRNGNKSEVSCYTEPSLPSTTSTEYNAYSLPNRIIDALGNTTTFLYDHHHINRQGQRVCRKITIDPLGYHKIETYNPQNLVASVELQNEHSETISFQEFFYHSLDKPLDQIEHVYEGTEKIREYQIHWDHDLMDRVITILEQKGDADCKQTRFTYDSSGKVLTITKPDGVILSHSYDLLGRLIQLKSSDQTISYSYSYNQHDDPVLIEDQVQNRTQTRSYNSFRQIIQERLIDSRTDVTHAFQFDNAGRLKQFIYPDGSSTSYEYDAYNLIQVDRKKRNGQIYTYKYLESNLLGAPLKSQMIGNAGQLTYEYDILGRHATLQSSYYQSAIASDGFDAAGNLRALTINTVVGASNTYTYDAHNQLKQESGAFQHSYEHDSINNRLKQDNQPLKIDSLNRVKACPSFEYTYDRNGNTLTKHANGSTTHFSYDALNRLIQVEAPDGEKTFYTYDSFGKRQTKEDSSGLQQFIYQEDVEVGVIVNSRIIQLKVLGSGKRGALGASIAIELNGSTYAPINDHRGNIVCLIDPESGELVELYHYSAFGETQIYDGKGFSLSESALGNPWTFASGRLDSETGLMLFRHRYYNPQLGRWLTPDPLDFADGPNLYAYVHNRPLILADPYGLFAFILENILPEEPKLRSRHFSFEDRPKLKNAGIGFVNGINCDFEGFKKNLAYVSDLSGGYSIDGVYNNTNGLPLDSIEAWLAIKFHLKTTPVKLLQENWNRFFRDHDENAVYLQICHSYGAALVRNALEDYPESLRKNIIVITIAPGARVGNWLCQSAHNFCSYGDAVHLVDILGSLICHPNSTYLPMAEGSSFVDHEFMSPTFIESLSKNINNYLKAHEHR